MALQFHYGLRIAGFGDLANEASGYRTLLSTDIYTTSVSRYRPGLLEPLTEITTETMPLEGSTTHGTITFEVVIDPAADTLTNDLMRFLWARRRKADQRLDPSTTPLSSSATTITLLNEVGGQDPVAGSVIYIGREAIKVGSVGGTASNRVLSSCTRGWLDTQAEGHDDVQGAVWIGLASNPLPRDREVFVYRCDRLTDTETIIWRGHIEIVAYDAIKQTLKVTVRSLLSRIGSQRLGDGRYRARFGAMVSPLHDDVIMLMPPGDVPESDIGYQPLYAANTSAIPGAGTSKLMTFDIDGRAAQAAHLGSFASPYKQGWYRHPAIVGRIKILDGESWVPDSSEIYDLYEILITDVTDEGCLFKDDAGDPSNHPLDMILCILTSSGSATWPLGGSHTVGSNGAWDWLHKPWGLGVPVAMIDTAGFTAARDSYPLKGLDLMRSGYLGAGDELPTAIDIISDMLIASGCYMLLDTLGRLSVRRFRAPGQLGFDATITEAHLLGAREASSVASPTAVMPVYAIEAEVGQRGPGGKYTDLLVGQDLGEDWQALYRGLAEIDSISATRIYGDAETHKLSSNETRVLMSQILLPRYLYQLDQLPTYDVELHTQAPEVAAGYWILLSAPELYDVDGTRGFTDHICLVISANRSFSDHVQKVRVLDWSFLTGSDSFICPSFRVKTVTDSTHFTIEGTAFSDADGDFFQTGSGYRMNLWSPEGAVLSTDGPVAASSFNPGTGAVVLATAWKASGSPITPAVGDVIRISNYGQTGFDDWANDKNSWWSDASGKLGPSNATGQIWSE